MNNNEERLVTDMSYYKLEYKPELFWCWVITKSDNPNESYVLSNHNEVEILHRFLQSKNKEIPEYIQKIIEKSKTVEEIMKKKIQKKILWVVDAQNDFMKPEGALYVQDAEKIIPKLIETVEKFKKLGVQIVCTMDLHNDNSEEISSNPDFIKTFPKHCMQDTDGDLLIDELAQEIYPVSVDVVDWFDYYNYQDLCEIARQKKIIITKDKFDVFEGNKYTDKLLEIIKPDVVYVCGVASNVCVDKAVMGLIQRGIKVYVIVNAIKELPNIPVSPIIENWVKNGVILI